MKEVVVLSGKGGTGKTSIAGSFAALAKNKVLVDCDVDAPDLHLLLQPAIQEEHEFWSGQTASIDPSKCTQCGLCQELCRFGAIKEFTIDPKSCEGCGLCSRACPAEAVTMKDNLAGRWYVSNTRHGPMVHARLGSAQENSGKLVAVLRKRAREIAEREKLDYIIGDGPPGIGCPVISSLSGANLALVVTEPTLSGIHDLERIIGVCRHFGIPALVCINKFDVNRENTSAIENQCLEWGVEVAARIPFDSSFTEAIICGLPLVEFMKSGVSCQISSLWEQVKKKLDANNG